MTPAGAVEGDADGVEADLVVAREVAAALRHPGGGEAADLALLAGADREDRPLGAEVGALASRLDLEEDQGRAVEGDEVELAEAGARVALDDLPAGGGEARGDEVLGGAAQSEARLGHRPDASSAPRAGGAPDVAIF